MNKALEALQAIKGKYKILDPVTLEDELAKQLELTERAARNAPAKVRKQMSEAEAIEKFYSTGNKKD